jgi:ElaB/YqjD/DUF883 family membrane-anchored ribosome-binding protein
MVAKKTMKKEDKLDNESKKRIEAAKQKAQKELEIIKTRLLAAEKKAHAYMEKNPEKTILIAAGVGAAVGAAVAFALKKK